MSILEISHRSKPFEEIIAGAEARHPNARRDPRRLPRAVPAGRRQPAVLDGADEPPAAGGSADYIVTGAWSQKAVKEAKRVGGVKIAASTEAENFTRVPEQGELTLDPAAAYVHYTTNNTIFGTEFGYVPDTGGVPLVADTSSDMFSGPIDVSKFALIYAGAQKNLAPAGVTLRDHPRRHAEAHAVVDPDDAAVPGARGEQVALQHAAGVHDLRHAAGAGVAAAGRAGSPAIDKVNARKSGKLYAEIDRTGFYRGSREAGSRSRMNVTFRLPSEELEKRFAKEATAAGLDGLKGHRSVGGMRASIYNAFPEAGVDALVQFMREFEKSNG